MAMSRKAKIGILIFVLLLAIPVFLLSDWFLGWVQSRIDKTFETTGDPSASWQAFLGRVYDITLREKDAASAYSRYLDRVEPKSQEELDYYVEIKYQYAIVLEACNKYNNAVVEYQDIADNYPNHPRAEAALTAVKRITLGAVAPRRGD